MLSKSEVIENEKFGFKTRKRAPQMNETVELCVITGLSSP